MDDKTPSDVDAYYGDDVVDGEIDMSFLDDKEEK